MKGKRGLIMGVANQHSIAWGIAQALHEAGAELAFSYQGDLFKKRVTPAGRADESRRADRLRCHQSGARSTPPLPSWRRFGAAGFRGPCHRLSDKDQLKGRYVDTTAENFRMTMDISAATPSPRSRSAPRS